VFSFAQPSPSNLQPQTFLVLTLKTDRGVFQNDWHFGFYKDMPIEKARVKVEGQQWNLENFTVQPSTFTLNLTTDKPAFFVWANAKGVPGEFDDNCFTLLPGRPKTIVGPAKLSQVSVVSLCDMAK